VEVQVMSDDKFTETRAGDRKVLASAGSANGREYGEEITNLGRKLHDLRRATPMRLEELSERTNLSIGLLSQIERGKGNPSFVTLMKLADAFQIQLGHFFSDSPATHIVVRKPQRRKIVFPTPGLTYELCTPDLNRQVAMIWTKLEPGARTQEGPFSHEGEECLVLTQGVLEAHIGDEVFVLGEGDSITFDSATPHWYFNPGPDVAETFGAMTPPSW
jgi:transcriptional regulator with XRE-family HTH domain